MRPVGPERIDRSVQLTPDRTGRRLPAHIIDRAADRGESRHERQGSLHKIDLREICSIHHPRSDALRADPDAVVEHRHLAKREAAHGKTGRRAGHIDRQHADRALHGLRGGAIAPIAHGLLVDDLYRGRRLEDREAKEARTGRDHTAVERRRQLTGVAGRLRHRHWLACWTRRTLRRSFRRAFWTLAGRTRDARWWLRRRNHYWSKWFGAL